MQAREGAEPVPVILEAPDGAANEGVIYARVCQDAEAKRIGWTYCAIIYVLGSFSLVNPLLHFVVPPLWIIAGPLMARHMRRKFRGRHFVDDGHGACPMCGAAAVIRLAESQWPQGHNKCPGCQEYFTVRIVAPAKAFAAAAPEALPAAGFGHA